MAVSYKSKYQEASSALEDSRAEVARLGEHEVALLHTIDRLNEEITEITSRSVARNSEYEREIRELRDALTGIISEAEKVVNEIADRNRQLIDQDKFLVQTLAAIASYPGPQIGVVQDLALIAIADRQTISMTTGERSEESLGELIHTEDSPYQSV